MQIRVAVPDDAEIIAQLVNRAYRPTPGDESGWTHEAEIVEGDRVNVNAVLSALQQTVVLVGVDRSNVVACVQIEVRERTAYIGMLAVDPSLQASGVGRTLLAAAEEFSVRNLQAEEAVLIVIAARKELIDYYLRRGYQKSNEQLRYPDEEGVGVPSEKARNLAVLKKHLDSATHVHGRDW